VILGGAIALTDNRRTHRGRKFEFQSANQCEPEFAKAARGRWQRSFDAIIHVLSPSWQTVGSRDA
jgi:hypothetical protein